MPDVFYDGLAKDRIERVFNDLIAPPSRESGLFGSIFLKLGVVDSGLGRDAAAILRFAFFFSAGRNHGWGRWRADMLGYVVIENLRETGAVISGHPAEVEIFTKIHQTRGLVEETYQRQAAVGGKRQRTHAVAKRVGTQGAWTGSQWVMVEESENSPVQHAAYAKATSKDTVRSRSFTGKPARMLRNDWTEAWENPDNPKPLGMPLQYMVSGMAVAATHKYPDESVDVAFNPVGQVVGQFTKVEKTATVIERWVQEYLEATGRLEQLNEAASV